MLNMLVSPFSLNLSLCDYFVEPTDIFLMIVCLVNLYLLIHLVNTVFCMLNVRGTEMNSS